MAANLKLFEKPQTITNPGAQAQINLVMATTRAAIEQTQARFDSRAQQDMQEQISSSMTP